MYSFIFDVDGTLIDSYDGITSAVEAVLKKHDCNIDDAREFILKESFIALLYLLLSLNDPIFNQFK